MKFSARLPRELRPNTLARLLSAKRKTGASILDLSESNPTHAGIEYPADLLMSLADERALRYEPQPFGLPSAREAIAVEYAVPLGRVTLTASTSEAYAWVFKLLCDPGDEILVPRPSYPLFEYLGALESVVVRHYSLFYDHGWFIDFHTIERTLNNRTRAIVLVNPNNPTGHFLRRHELPHLVSICADRDIAIISDEVFADYELRASPDHVKSLRDLDAALVFTLHGLSKSIGLPQMKLGWMIANGPRAELAEAIERLEIIADTYLSVGTPIQCAVRQLLGLRRRVQEQILRRLRENLDYLLRSGLRVLPVDAGWYAVIMLDASRTEEEWVEHLLRERDVLVQPGFFYDFERSGYAVVSLLTKNDVFRQGVDRITEELRT